jgi:hypothetical protein
MLLLRALPQAIKRLQKEPILLEISVRVTQRGIDNCDLVGRKKTLTKGIFAVTLTKWLLFLNGHTYKEMEGLTSKDRCKLFWIWTKGSLCGYRGLKCKI